MDWTNILNQFIDILLPVLATILTAVGTYVATRIKTAYTEKVNNETAKKVIEDVVKYVQQVYKDVDGETKLQKATEKVSEILLAKGITVTEAEINMLIESSVYGIKQGLTQTEEPKQIEEKK